MKHNENYSQIAPHAVEQSLVIKHINERFASWKTSIHDIQDLLKEVEILEKELDKAYANTLKKLDNKDEEFGQSVSQIFQPLKDYSIQMHSMFESVQSKNEVQVTKRLKLLKQQLSSRTNEFSKALQKAQHNIELARENAKREMIKYEKEDMSRKRDHIAPSHPHSQTDPWLDSKYVWDKINLLINEENVYQESMRHLFTEIGAYDNQIAEELNLILVEHNILRKEQMSLFLQNLRPESLHPTMKHDYFENFSSAHGLTSEQLWKSAVSAENFPFSAPEIQIHKQSIAYRRSKIGLGWEPVLLVLTASGYLHQFEAKKDKQIVKHYKQQELSRDVTSGSLNRSRENSEIDQNILDETHKPSLSISLAQPRLNIQPSSKKGDSHAFDIVVLKRREGINKLLHKEKDVTVTYEYKCLSEADMIEWMALLQKISAKLFPQNQPKPLFKSSDKIEETVEEMIKQQNFSRSDSSVIGNQVGESSTDIKTAAPNRDQSSATMTDSNPNITIIEGVVHSK